MSKTTSIIPNSVDDPNKQFTPKAYISIKSDGKRCPNCGFLITHEETGRICFFSQTASHSAERWRQRTGYGTSCHYGARLHPAVQ